MIHPELKVVLCADVNDLASFQPDDLENFSVSLQLLIVPKHEAGMESFEVTICTPAWLTSHFNKDEIILVRHYLILFEYNYERLVNRIKKHLQLCSGETWSEVASKLSRLGHWEFEDYQVFKG